MVVPKTFGNGSQIWILPRSLRRAFHQPTEWKDGRHPTWPPNLSCRVSKKTHSLNCRFAITYFLGGTFGQNLVMGAVNIFMDQDIPWNPVSQNSNKCMFFGHPVHDFLCLWGCHLGQKILRWPPFRGFAISSLHVSSDDVVIGLTLSRPCCWECLIFGGCGGQNLSAREYGLYRNDLIPAFWLCHFPKISSPHLCFCLNIIQVKEIKPKQQAVEKIANF